MPSTKRQFQIRLRLTILDLASTRRNTIPKLNRLTRGIARFDCHSPAGKSIAKHITHIVPDVAAVEVVCEDCLADVRLEDAVILRSDFDGDAAAHWVAAEGLAVGLVLGQNHFGSD